MRVVSLHADVLIVTSAIWQTNCTIVRGRIDDGSSGEMGAETFVIDSPVLPEELEALPALIEQSHFPPPSGLLATHADWDHLLGRLAFPQATLGCSETTARRLESAIGAPQRELRAFDKQFYIERSRPLVLGSIQALPVPGRCAIGERELELHPAEGHTEDGMAVWIAWAGVLVLGDYLSKVEPPDVGSESLLGAYLETLERLRPLVESAEHVVPGHGPVMSSEQALGVLEEDLAYLGALSDKGVGAELPAGRRTKAQRRLHAENAARVVD